ncbi:PREDICTED: alkane hydroxylase MAH1-like [Nelumbo nucifera]|uniref:Alkane hydroxylase MAH1-like n=1 Tax=Nelumbo nucifera TaxID=4432 RepID=A0A1U8B0I7_NELNU|nr:PREDICTED: alkane hydroxylase MAH1-like [Nelumbo nucifera]
MELQTILTFLSRNLNRWPEFLLALVCFLSIRWYRKHKNEISLRWPILDVLPTLLLNAHRIHSWTVEIANKFGSTIEGRGPVFGRLDILFTCDPRNVEYMLKTNFANFPKGPELIEAFNILGDGIFNVDYDLWREQRRMANVNFASKDFRNFVARVSRTVVEDGLLPLLVHAAKHESVVDLEDVFMRFAFDNMFMVVFGRNSNHLSVNLPPNELAEAIDDGTEGVFYRHVMPKLWWKVLGWLKLGSEKKLADARKTIDRILSEQVALKKEELRRGEHGSDLITMYITALSKGRHNIKQLSTAKDDDVFLRDTALSFLFAGRDTTGTSLSWFFWFVSTNPRVEAKILEELNDVMSRKKNEKNGMSRVEGPLVFDPEDLKELVYLHAALCESLRLCPPLPITRRGVVRKDVLPDGTVVKPGMQILISMYAMGRMDYVWGKDYGEYKPERWIDADGKLNQETLSKLFSFIVGPRSCPGKNMAFTQMKAAAATVLFNFHIEVLNGHDIFPMPSMVLHTKNGLVVKVTERV